MQLSPVMCHSPCPAPEEQGALLLLGHSLFLFLLCPPTPHGLQLCQGWGWGPWPLALCPRGAVPVSRGVLLAEKTQPLMGAGAP